jgi:hypothetical protein
MEIVAQVSQAVSAPGHFGDGREEMAAGRRYDQSYVEHAPNAPDAETAGKQISVKTVAAISCAKRAGFY